MLQVVMSECHIIIILAHKGEMAIAYRIFVQVQECERSLTRHRHRGKDNIKIGLMKWDGRLWTGLTPQHQPLYMV